MQNKISLLPVPDFFLCKEILGGNLGMLFHTKCKMHEFRSAISIGEQLRILRNTFMTVTVNDICKIFNISIRKYYSEIKEDNKSKQFQPLPPSRKLLTNEEESILINKIKNYQINNNCLTGQEVRKKAEKLYFKRTNISRNFTRDWFHDFCKRHESKIKRIKASSLEEARSHIKPEEIEDYIKKIESLMQNPPNPLLLINFDETGFGKRPDKGKRKTILVSNSCNKTPYWQEIKDQHHISLVAAITAACTSLRPLLLSHRKTMDPDINGTFFERWGSYFYTSKGYMNAKSMIFWVQNILAPYVMQCRDRIGQDQRCVIIADGCSCHFPEEVMQEIEKIGNIEVILLPAHSSHITQMLDRSAFAAIKRKYSFLQYDEDLVSKFTKKLIRIKKSYQSTMNEELIKSSWEAAGFKINILRGVVTGYEFKEEFKERLRSEIIQE